MNVHRLTLDNVLRDMVHNASYAGHVCHRATKSNVNDIDFLKKLIGFGHESVLEHITLSFACYDFSRALLQELARHRHISLSVESTRHAMHKRMQNNGSESAEAVGAILTEATDPLITSLNIDDDVVDDAVVDSFGPLLKGYVQWMTEINKFMDFMLSKGANISKLNDFCKYLLPECFPTDFVMTCNLRELRHIFKLRTSPAALHEFRLFCGYVYAVLPEWFRVLVDDCVNKEDSAGISQEDKRCVKMKN